MTPTDLLNIAELGVTTGSTWLAKYPTFNPGFITQAAYLSHHETMRDVILQQITTKDARSQAVLALKEANKSIEAHVKHLKNYLSEEYANDAKTYYSGYGIVLNGTSWTYPKDNDHRMRSLDTLVAELSKPNHVFANKKFGLAFWQDLRDAHRANWTSLKNLDGSRSVNSSTLATQKKEALSYQSRLKSSLKIHFPNDYKAIVRDFGFQTEKY